MPKSRCRTYRLNGCLKLALACYALFLVSITARAHPNLQNALQVEFEPKLVRVVVNVSVRELAVAHAIQHPPNGGVATAALQGAAEQHRDYVLLHLRLAAGEELLVGKICRVVPPRVFADPAETFYQYEIEYPVNGPLPATIGLFHDMLEEWPYAAGTAWDVSYVVRVKRAGASDTDASGSWLLPYQKSANIPTGWNTAEPAAAGAAPVPGAQGWRAFRDYFWHGVTHILTGYDHLLFVCALVLATLSFWEMVKVIAAFTLAHTLTLALCAFGIFRLPAYIVEPVIALSIVAVALENVLWPQRARSKIRLAVAFGFGLIHGLGFAGGLLDAMAGLPAIGIWIALAAFSLGVECGHQLVVLPLFALLKLSRHSLREQTHPIVLRWGSAAVSCGGVYYLVVALHQQFFC
ncbi:MAG: HupE/UreJ family protein [Verrucomicrobiota bacterium]